MTTWGGGGGCLVEADGAFEVNPNVMGTFGDDTDEPGWCTCCTLGHAKSAINGCESAERREVDAPGIYGELRKTREEVKTDRTERSPGMSTRGMEILEVFVIELISWWLTTIRIPPYFFGTQTRGEPHGDVESWM